MSTEKDRDIFEMATEQYHQDQLQDQILRVRKAVDYGIQHARQGERERLKRFIAKYDSAIATGRLSSGEFALNDDMVIDEFLEQEKSK